MCRVPEHGMYSSQSTAQACCCSVLNLSRQKENRLTMNEKDWISPATWRNGLVRQKSAYKAWLEAEAEHRVSPSTLAQRYTSRVLACRCGQVWSGAAGIHSRRSHTRTENKKRLAWTPAVPQWCSVQSAHKKVETCTHELCGWL